MRNHIDFDQNVLFSGLLRAHFQNRAGPGLDQIQISDFGPGRALQKSFGPGRAHGPMSARSTPSVQGFIRIAQRGQNLKSLTNKPTHRHSDTEIYNLDFFISLFRMLVFYEILLNL